MIAKTHVCQVIIENLYNLRPAKERVSRSKNMKHVDVHTSPKLASTNQSKPPLFLSRSQSKQSISVACALSLNLCLVA
jgi:hypothetical protein